MTGSGGVPAYTSVVVGTDGSDLAGPTVGRAAAVAAAHGAKLTVVCAFSEVGARDDARNVGSLIGEARTGPRSGQVSGREAAAQVLSEAVRIAHEREGIDVATVLMDGDPAAALLAAVDTRSADLLIVGASHDLSLSERLLGTVAAEVVRKAPCDVLIVRPS